MKNWWRGGQVLIQEAPGYSAIDLISSRLEQPILNELLSWASRSPIGSHLFP